MNIQESVVADFILDILANLIASMIWAFMVWYVVHEYPKWRVMYDQSHS